MRTESILLLSQSPAVCVALISIALSACSSTDTPTRPTATAIPLTALAASQSSESCINVFAEGTASLGVVTLPNGTTGFGGSWVPVTLGGISGEMASVVLTQERSGSGQQGALHLMLQHAFQTQGGDYFLTEDRAVCAPAGTNPVTCRVNDALTIVGGTGIFSNANGSLRNHGTIDFAQGTLDFSIRGRVCGDGL
jgi:hypothetical protein